MSMIATLLRVTWNESSSKKAVFGKYVGLAGIIKICMARGTKGGGMKVYSSAELTFSPRRLATIGSTSGEAGKPLVDLP